MLHRKYDPCFGHKSTKIIKRRRVNSRYKYDKILLMSVNTFSSLISFFCLYLFVFNCFAVFLLAEYPMQANEGGKNLTIQQTLAVSEPLLSQIPAIPNWNSFPLVDVAQFKWLSWTPIMSVSFWFPLCVELATQWRCTCRYMYYLYKTLQIIQQPPGMIIMWLSRIFPELCWWCAPGRDC